MAKSTKKDFLKKVSIVGGAGILGLSRFGKMSAKAAVLDNSETHEITNDRIFMNSGTYTDETPLQSGATAQKVAEAVNNLHTNFSQALTDIKNTAIAQAVGAKGENFPDVIEELGAIEDFGQVTFTAKTVSDIEIKPGYYAEGSKVEVSNTEILTDPNLRDEVLTVISSGEYSTAFDSNEDGNMDKVYKAVKVQVTKDKGTGKEVYDEGVKDTKKGNAIAEHVLAGKTFTSEQAGVEMTGSMPNNGAWSKTTGSNGKIMIPKGCHDGNGSITIAVTKDTPAGQPIYNAGYNAGYSSGKSAGQTELKNAGYVKPSGEVNITSNGTHNVSGKASVKVNVPSTPRNASVSTYSPSSRSKYTNSFQTSTAAGGTYIELGQPSCSVRNGVLTVSIPETVSPFGYHGDGDIDVNHTRIITVSINLS